MKDIRCRPCDIVPLRLAESNLLDSALSKTPRRPAHIVKHNLEGSGWSQEVSMSFSSSVLCRRLWMLPNRQPSRQITLNHFLNDTLVRVENRAALLRSWSLRSLNSLGLAVSRSPVMYMKSSALDGSAFFGRALASME